MGQPLWENSGCKGYENVKGLEGKPCEECLRALDLLSLEETEGNLTAVTPSL